MSWWRQGQAWSPGARVHWPRSPGALEMSPGPGILQLLGTSEPQGSWLECRCLGSEVPGSWTRLGTLRRGPSANADGPDPAEDQSTGGTSGARAGMKPQRCCCGSWCFPHVVLSEIRFHVEA